MSLITLFYSDWQGIIHFNSFIKHAFLRTLPESQPNIFCLPRQYLAFIFYYYNFIS